MVNRGIGLLVSVTSAELEHLLIAKNPIILKRTSPVERIKQLPVPIYFAVKGHKGVIAARGQLDFIMPTIGEERILSRTIYTFSQFEKAFPATYENNTRIAPHAVAWEISNISRIFTNISRFTQITANGRYQPVVSVPKGWIYIVDEPRIRY